MAAGITSLASGGGLTPLSLEVRSTTHLTSYSPAGSAFRCVVIRPLESNGQILIPRGSIVTGSVRRAKAVGLGIIRERATIDLSFAEYRTPDGRMFPLHARLASIDNARERVTRSGQIRGVIAANDPNRFIFGLWLRPSTNMISRSLIGLTGASNQIWSKLEMGPIGAVALFALRYKMFPLAEPEIRLPPGTDMKLAVSVPPPDSKHAAIPAAPQIAPEFSDWVREQPFEIEREDGRPAPDIINVVFIGSEQDLRDAFSMAGWYLADPATIRNYSRMFGAFNSMREYSSAPVSTLLYQDTPPAFVFEKSLNSVAKRHHIRIWQGGIVDGEEVWLGAATHDTGIGFDFRSVSFTHKIDSRIDLERTKFVTDLIFAGCSEAPTKIERQDAAESTGKNANASITDGAVAVLDLQPCTAPTDFDDSPAPFPKPGRLKRFTRRFILETRNYIVRENFYYWGYRLIERKWGPQASDR
jgi:hypothetical protein